MKRHFIKFLKRFQNIRQYFLIYMGLTSYWYDQEKGVYERNTVSGTVATAVNIMGAIVLVQVLIDYLEVFENIEQRHRLMVIMSSFKYLQGLLVLNAIVHIWRTDGSYTAIKWQIEKLEEQSRSNFASSKKIDGQFKKLLYFKYFIITYLYLSVLITSYTLLSRDMNFWTIFRIVLLANLQYLTYLILFQYFQMFWKTCRIYGYIELYISCLAEEAILELPSKNDLIERHLCYKLSWLLQLHSNLGSCLRRLQILCKSQIFQCRYNVNVNDIIAVYYAFLYPEYIKDDVAFLLLVVSTNVFNNIDLYLNDNMIDMTSQHFTDLNLALRKFTGVRSYARDLERQVNIH